MKAVKKPTNKQLSQRVKSLEDTIILYEDKLKEAADKIRNLRDEESKLKAEKNHTHNVLMELISSNDTGDDDALIKRAREIVKKLDTPLTEFYERQKNTEKERT